jgi:hypothetical protein
MGTDKWEMDRGLLKDGNVIAQRKSTGLKTRHYKRIIYRRSGRRRDWIG